SVASDLYRAWALSRYDVHLAESTASVLMDRALGVLSVVLVATAALPFAPGLAGRGVFTTLAVLAAICAAGAASVFSERAAGAVRALARAIPLDVARRGAHAPPEGRRRERNHHADVGRGVAPPVALPTIRLT